MLSNLMSDNKVRKVGDNSENEKNLDMPDESFSDDSSVLVYEEVDTKTVPTELKRTLNETVLHDRFQDRTNDPTGFQTPVLINTPKYEDGQENI